MPMTVSKTREMLVDVARQLFARMGVDNTTMNDIAQASKKGRRTLYTYFKSKNEIYLAVVESELDQLYKMLQDVAAKDLPVCDDTLVLHWSDGTVRAFSVWGNADSESIERLSDQAYLAQARISLSRDAGTWPGGERFEARTLYERSRIAGGVRSERQTAPSSEANVKPNDSAARKPKECRALDGTEQQSFERG